MDKLVVRGTEINVQLDLKRDDFLSLTDIAKIKDSDNPRYIIQNWLRNRNTDVYKRQMRNRIFTFLMNLPAVLMSMPKPSFTNR